MQRLQQPKQWESWIDEFLALSKNVDFSSKIDVRIDGCFLWLGSVSPSGYGQSSKGKAHRVSYELANGTIPEGLVIGHVCDNRRCVRPGHLVACSQKQNVHDAWAKGRAKQGSFPGESNPSAKLNAVNVEEMKRMRLQGYTFRQIGDFFGVSPSNAYNAVKGISYK